MATMQRFLISLATGIVVVFSFFFLLLLTYKIFFPTEMPTWFVWVMAWPIFLCGGFFRSFGRHVLIWSSIAIALISYIVVATAGIFLLLLPLRKRPEETSRCLKL